MLLREPEVDLGGEVRQGWLADHLRQVRDADTVLPAVLELNEVDNQILCLCSAWFAAYLKVRLHAIGPLSVWAQLSLPQTRSSSC